MSLEKKNELKEKVKQIKFSHETSPMSYFELVRIEELLDRQLDHNIFENHIVEFYIIFFAINGEGTHSIDFTDYKYSSGSVLLIKKDRIHRFHKSSNVKGYLMIFTEEFIVSHLNKLESMKSLLLFNGSLSFPKIELNASKEELSDFTSLIKQIEREYKYKDEYAISITRSALHMAIAKLFRFKSKRGQLISKQKYLEEFLGFQNLVETNCFSSKKVKDYAQKLGFTTKTLNNIVQSIVNKSAKSVIDEIAIMQIKRLLISTNQSVKEIAYTSGFEDSTNFFKYFKKHVGTSPEAFRQGSILKTKQ